MDAFPAFVPLQGARVVIAGEGEAADAKARLFEGSPARVVRVTDAGAAGRPEVYAQARLVFIAVPLEATAPSLAAARASGALINVVDQPALCDFHTPSIIDRGAVVGAIGTGGWAPLLASRLRTEWEARWPAGLGRLAALLRDVRPHVRERFSDMRVRRAALTGIIDGEAGAAALAGEPERAMALALNSLDGPPPRSGKVVRIAAPSDPEDLTVRDLRALARADRVVAPAAISSELLAHARRDAVRVPDADEASLTAWAGAGEWVVVISPPATESAAR